MPFLILMRFVLVNTYVHVACLLQGASSLASRLTNVSLDICDRA